MCSKNLAFQFSISCIGSKRQKLGVWTAGCPVEEAAMNGLGPAQQQMETVSQDMAPLLRLMQERAVAAVAAETGGDMQAHRGHPKVKICLC